MMRFKQLLVIACVCVSSAQFSHAQSSSTQDTFSQSILDQFLDENKLTGANLLVSGPDDRLVWSSGF
jgi:hypothetical protein